LRTCFLHNACDQYAHILLSVLLKSLVQTSFRLLGLFIHCLKQKRLLMRSRNCCFCIWQGLLGVPLIAKPHNFEAQMLPVCFDFTKNILKAYYWARLSVVLYEMNYFLKRNLLWYLKAIEIFLVQEFSCFVNISFTNKSNTY
jgi:hypothetical protein